MPSLGAFGQGAGYAGLGAGSGQIAGYAGQGASYLGMGAGTGLGAGYAGHAGHAGHGLGYAHLPSDVEVQETYSAFGVELQQWVRALASTIDQQVIEPMLMMLDSSDHEWQQALAQRGWRLTSEPPMPAYPGLGMGMGASGTQEISIFDRNLPKPWCDDPMCVDKWNKRQCMETFLVPPAFCPPSHAIRQYVLERLREWRQRGVAKAIRHDWRLSENMPTDGHIFENLVIRTIQMNFHEFPDCFMSCGHATPHSKHLGQVPTAYLRQVAEQATSIKPAPHYEVVTMQKVWRLRPGSNNMLEALALLMHFLKRHSRSYQAAFPQPLKVAFESPQHPHSSFMQPLRSIYNGMSNAANTLF